MQHILTIAQFAGCSKEEAGEKSLDHNPRLDETEGSVAAAVMEESLNPHTHYRNYSDSMQVEPSKHLSGPQSHTLTSWLKSG